MAITYRIRADSVYYRTLIERYDRQRSFPLRYLEQFGMLGLVTAVIWLSTTTPLTANVVFQSFAVGILVMLGGFLAMKLGILLRFNRRSDFGQEHEVFISEDGIEAVGAHVKSHWTWPAYPYSVRFPDGILLLRKGAIRWLPDTAIVEGNPVSATELVASKTMLRHLDR